jgi:hypothetical protein
VQDDIPIVWRNGLIHDLPRIGRVFTEAYWPPPFSRALYRPFSSVGYAVQWALGDGSPVVFRLGSYALYALSAVAVFSLARLRLPLTVAAVTASLFAVHPVHVESVAVAVNQSELWVGLLACVMVRLYVQERSAGGPLARRTELVLAGLYLAACLFKENALVIPGLLLAAEALLVRTGEPLRVRLAHGRRPLLVLLLLAVAFYYARTLALSGSLAGTFVAEHLVGLTMGERAVAMLAVVPHWFRLLFWPAQLRADYGPGEIIAQTSWGWDHTLGVILLLGSVMVAIMARRRLPLLSFGIAWCAIGLFPVHNVLVPIGIILAERTLYLPSVGAMLMLGAVGAFALERVTSQGRIALGAAAAALLLAGIITSAGRHPVWHDQFGLWYKTANEDAPLSFRAHEALAEAYFQIGMEGMAEQEYQLAIQFAPVTMLRPRIAFANRLRTRGACYPAAQHYRTVVEIEPRHVTARAGLIACLLDLGRYREAMFHARFATSLGWQVPTFQQALRTADSALKVSAPPGTVRLILPATDTVRSHMTIGSEK